ncbi:Membrane protein involved in the export of O-antigen and teichoic acid [Marivirga sericea]|uniref:Membrane protein involved in the export of O-antigen and teichoic acid n=1 Tax=Marivirga sericea TaxID=1028 RepID=A0A1X7KMJ7_9BACT|nr:lipopolysaccharide biosynthesis protein [Marivirga sericea]SMG41939.1 Membrane protein involved in the export of O-antigen and teichoic acid [Marivirga sericea]
MTSLKNRSAKAFAWNIAGTVLKQGSGFIISIFLARLLEPAEFGLVGMAMVFITISQVFIDVGFSSALIQNKDNTSLTYSSIFYLNFAAGIVLTAIFYFGAPIIGNFYDNQEITSLIRWLSLIFVFNSLNLVQTAIFTRELDFKVLTLRNVIASSVGGILGVICAFQGFGVYSLVVQQISMALLTTLLLWTSSNWKPELKFSFYEVKRLTGFSAFVFFDQFIYTIFKQIDILFIGKVFSASVLGFYSRASSLKDQVILYTSQSLVKVFYPVLSSLQDQHKEYTRVYFKVVSVVGFVSYGLTGLLYVMGADVIVILFGEKWIPSIEVFQILVLAVCVFPLNGMMVNAFMSKGKSKQNFYLGLFRKFITILPLFIAYFYGIYEFTIALVIADYFLTFVNVYFSNRIIKIPYRVHLRKIFEGMVPLIIFVLLFNLVELASIYDRVFLAVGFGVTHLLYGYLIRIEGLLFIVENTKKYLAKRRR